MIRRIWSSICATRRGVNPRETRARILVCSGGSIPRKDWVLAAFGPEADFSRLTPKVLENRAESRNPVDTSAWRDRA